MPGALSYLIEKVEGLEKTAQSLLNRQEECCSPHWMDVDELCDYIPSHPVKQTVYGWVSDKQIPHHIGWMLTNYVTISHPTPSNKQSMVGYLIGRYRTTRLTKH